ncbi:hypothetical protein SDC9_159785 [bioreactor metagenome]|uniref:Uncharacterized protein n=1 Tax=bioreactor metagenome TaxID=1076179 RepID=A0A645FDS8_9ZZZZ
MISQQGAIHAVSYLLAHGCTEQLAKDMLASLRKTAQAIRDESTRREAMQLFDTDQLVYSSTPT